MKNEDREIMLYESEYEDEPVFVYAHNEAPHSAVFLDPSKRFDPVFRYARMMCAAALGHDPHRDVLLIGGGAYSMPKCLLSRDPEMNLDVVDVDPTVYDTALAFFSLQDLISGFDPGKQRLRPLTADGREYLENTDRKYDVILDDAFFGIIPVMSLLSREGALAAKSCLKEGGLFLANIPGYADVQSFPLTADIVLTFRSVFDHVCLLSAYSGASEDACNYILAASQMPLDPADVCEIDLSGASVITDSDTADIENNYVF